MTLAELYKPRERIKNAELILLEKLFGNKNKLAEVLNVNRSRISKWHKGESPDNINSEKIAGLNYLMTILLNNYYPETALKWLKGLNAHLNNRRPIELIKENEIEAVIKAARQSIAGSFA